MENNENQPIDFDSIAKAMQMAEALKGLFQETTDETVETTENNQSYSIATAFDEQLQSPEIKALKAAIPFLEPHAQKQVGLFTKLFEIKRLLQDVSSSDSVYESASHNDSGERQKKMLLSMRPHLQKNKQRIIDLLIKVNDMKDLMNIMHKMQEENRGE